jgi:predicted DNA repair protein MutK
MLKEVIFPPKHTKYSTLNSGFRYMVCLNIVIVIVAVILLLLVFGSYFVCHNGVKKERERFERKNDNHHRTGGQQSVNV